MPDKNAHEVAVLVARVAELFNVLKHFPNDIQPHQAEKADEIHPPELPQKVAVKDGHGGRSGFLA